MRFDEQDLTRRLATTLLPDLGLPGRKMTLSPPPERGTRSSLFIMRVEGMPRLLVRTFRRRATAVRNVQALRHLEWLDLRAPRLVFHDLSRTARLMSPSLPFMTVEIWIEGTRVSGLEDPETQEEALRKVASLLSRFRRVTRSTWGRPSRSRTTPYAAHTLRQARARLRRVASRGWLTHDEASRVQESFDGWHERIDRFREFNLVHKDANPDNFILTPEGWIVPVDLHRISYEPFPEEVITALHHFCPGDAGKEELFLQAYFARGGDVVEEVFSSTRGFFEPLYFLKKLDRRAADPSLEMPDATRDQWRQEVLAIRPPG